MVSFIRTMFTSDAIAHYGSQTAVAEVLGISRQAVSKWDELVPPLSAARLAKLSKGKLKFDPDRYGDWNSRKSEHGAAA